MSRVVWKFVMDAPWSSFDVRAPKVVHVGIDPASANLAVWMEVTPTPEMDLLNVRSGEVKFQAINTGGDVPSGWFHQGSVISSNGIVWHIYADRDLT